MTTKVLTKEDRERGWIPMTCGIHAWIFKAEVLRKMKEAGIEGEPCDCSGTRVLAACVEQLGKL